MQRRPRLEPLQVGILLSGHFDAVWWYGQMVVTWLLMNRDNKEGDLSFSYRVKIEGYQQLLANLNREVTPFGEVAFAIMD